MLNQGTCPSGARQLRALAWIIATILGLILMAATPVMASTIWYTAEEDRWGDDSRLYTIDTVSLAIADYGFLDRSYTTDLAFDATGRLFGVGWRNQNATGNGMLFGITPDGADGYQTGALETTGGQLRGDVNSLAFYGDLMLAASGDGHVQVLSEESNGHWRILSTTDLNKDIAGDIAVSADGQSAYVTFSNGKIGGYELNADGGFGDRFLYAATGYSRIFGLAFDSAGQLFGLTNTCGNEGPSYLVTIDTTTGLAGNPVDLGTSVWGATSIDSGVTTVPEPATLALFGLGGMAFAVGYRRRRRVGRTGRSA